MDKTSYANLARAWEYVENHAYSRQTQALLDAREQAAQCGLAQGSAAQAQLLHTLACMMRSTSVITSGSLVEIVQLVDALHGTGQLTAVDSSTQGIALIRKMFFALSDTTQTTLRAVNAPVNVFLPRLNGTDYDLIVVSGDAANYLDTFVQAPRLLREHGVIVFTDTKTRAEICTGQLKRAGFRADSIHSDKTQVQRKRALEGFSKGAIDVLVATDVLARGIDVSNIEYVVNYDLPESPEDYVHRIGRTGRAGETGYAISFVSPEAKAQLLDIEKLLGERIPTLDIDGYDATEAEKALASQFVPKATVGSAAFSRSLRRNGASGFGRRR